MVIFMGATLAATLVTAAVTPPAARPVPLTLVTERTANGVRLMVVGESAQAVEATYELAATSGPGTNRSVQRGTARLTPNRRATLVTLQLGDGAATGWSARLDVKLGDGSAYHQEDSSAPR